MNFGLDVGGILTSAGLLALAFVFALPEARGGVSERLSGGDDIIKV
ncbi:MAG: hypothetical protein ACR2GQ_02155 [Gemmatimonadota bacterium]